MMKLRYLLLGCVFVAFCASIEASDRVKLQGSKDKYLKAYLIGVSKQNYSLDIELHIENASHAILWICRDNDAVQDVLDSTIAKNDGKLFLKFKSVVVPKHIDLFVPICAKYQKLSRGESLQLTLHVPFPIGDNAPFRNKRRELMLKKLQAHGMKYEDVISDPELHTWAYTDLEQYETTLSFEELRVLEIEIGYYQKMFFGPRAVCRLTWGDIWSELWSELFKNEVFIDCFWAMKHPEQSVVFSINKEIIEQFLQ